MEQKQSIILLSLVILLAILSIATPTLSASNSKIQWNKMVADRYSKKFVPELNNDNVAYVLAENRNFTLFVVSYSPESSCRACQMMVEPLSKIMRTLQKDKSGDIPIFIYHLDVTKNYLHHILTKLSISRVPSIYSYGPGKIGFGVTERDIMPISYDTINFAFITNWINSIAGDYIDLPIPVWMRFVMKFNPANFGLFLVIPVLGFLYLLVTRPLHPFVWFTLTLVVYFCNQAGVVWNFIRNPQFMGHDSNSGEIKLIDHGNNQFIIEGIIAGTINSGIALSVLAMVILTPMIKNVWVRRAAFTISLSLAFFFFYCLMNIYVIKHPYYPFYFRMI